ncbi:MAG: hypothetical protein ABIH26_10525 [Candidatus Eisenbacteria bacterium]
MNQERARLPSMRVTKSRVLRVAFLPIFTFFTLFCSCTSKTMVQPQSAEPSDFEKVVAIRVVEQNGTEHVFRTGRVGGNLFHGTDENGRVRAIELDKIWYLEVERTDAKKTVGAIIGIPILVLLGGVAVLLIVAAATSCPSVYSYDGERWILDAEPYSGAIAATCPRVDYQVLEHLRACDGEYRLLFAGRKGEIEYSDEVKLVVADADSSVEVLPDGRGGFVRVEVWEPPVAVRTGAGSDLSPRMGPGGELYWEGDPTADYGEGARPREELYLKFRKPPGAKRATFLLRGNNTPWASHVMAEFLGRYGPGARMKLDRLNSDPDAAAKVEKLMKKDGGWIEVQVFREGEWQTAGHLRDVGSSQVVETLAVGLDLADVHEDVLQLRLRWGPMFWHVMRVGIDYSESRSPLLVKEIEAVTAIDSKRGNIRPSLSATDRVFYRAEEGDEAILTFAAPQAVPGKERTLILKASGYYNLLLPEAGGSSLATLLVDTVRRRGLDVFSRDLLLELRAQPRESG